MISLYLLFSSIKSVQFYLQKHIGTKLNFYEYLLVNSIVFFAISICIFIYNIYRKKENYKNIEKLDSLHIAILFAISIFSISSIFFFFIISEQHTIPIFLTISKVISVIIIIGIGHYIYNEKLKPNEIIGIIFCIIGIYFLYNK